MYQINQKFCLKLLFVQYLSKNIFRYFVSIIEKNYEYLFEQMNWKNNKTKY